MTLSASLFAISKVPSREPESTTMISTSTVCDRSDLRVRSIVAAESRERTIALAPAVMVPVSRLEVDQTRSDRLAGAGDIVGAKPVGPRSKPTQAGGEGAAAAHAGAVAAASPPALARPTLQPEHDLPPAGARHAPKRLKQAG